MGPVAHATGSSCAGLRPRESATELALGGLSFQLAVELRRWMMKV